MKAILVLDEMPKTCFECELCEQKDVGRFYCASTGDADGVGYRKPDWCPLREMPEPYEPEPAYYTDEESFEVGYNAALDDVEGNT